MEHSLFCIFINYCIIFHLNNCKPNFCLILNILAKRYKQSSQKKLKRNTMCILYLVQMAFTSYLFAKVKENWISCQWLFFFVGKTPMIKKTGFFLLFLIIFEEFSTDWKMLLTPEIFINNIWVKIPWWGKKSQLLRNYYENKLLKLS